MQTVSSVRFSVDSPFHTYRLHQVFKLRAADDGSCDVVLRKSPGVGNLGHRRSDLLRYLFYPSIDFLVSWRVEIDKLLHRGIGCGSGGVLLVQRSSEDYIVVSRDFVHSTTAYILWRSDSTEYSPCPSVPASAPSHAPPPDTQHSQSFAC